MLFAGPVSARHRACFYWGWSRSVTGTSIGVTCCSHGPPGSRRAGRLLKTPHKPTCSRVRNFAARWTSGEVAGLSRQSGWVRIPHESLALGRPTVQDAALIRRKRRFDSFPSDDRRPGRSRRSGGDLVATRRTGKHGACRAHDVVAACCLAMAEVRVQFPLGALGGRLWGESPGTLPSRRCRRASRASGAVMEVNRPDQGPASKAGTGETPLWVRVPRLPLSDRFPVAWLIRRGITRGLMVQEEDAGLACRGSGCDSR